MRRLGPRRGAGRWRLQRASAALVAALTLALAVAFLARPAGYASWQALCRQPLVRVLLQGWFIGVGLHAWVGMRDIVTDYVPAKLQRAGKEAVTLALVIDCMWSANLIWSLST